MHLYYNMASFLIKGRSLEKRYGSKNFFFILMFLIIAASGMYVLVAKIMTEITESELYLKSCAIGFSGLCVSILSYYLTTFIFSTRSIALNASCFV